MERAASELSEFLAYERLSAIGLLEKIEIAKADINTLIACPKFERASAKIDQAMERYNSKVEKSKADIQQLDADIAYMQKQQRKWDRKSSTFMLDRTDVKAVEKQNHAVHMFRRLGDQIAAAQEKRSDLIDRHSAAVEEAEERLQELSREALLVIDEDIVAALDKCTRIVDKLSGSQNPAELAAAVEVALIALKLFALLEDYIEDNNARKDCRDRISDVNRLLADLSANAQLRNYLTDLYHRNTALLQKNVGTLGEVKATVASIEPNKYATQLGSIHAVLDKEYDTEFKYDGVVDPAELASIVGRIERTIEELKSGIAAANEISVAVETDAQSALEAHQKAMALLSTMTTDVHGIEGGVLDSGHFAAAMLQDAVVDEFYRSEVRPAIVELRRHIAEAVGKESLDMLLSPHEDRYVLAQTEAVITEANLSGLHDARERIAGHVARLAELIRSAEADIAKAGNVPKENAESLLSELTSKYVLSCVPAAGLLFVFQIRKLIRTYEPALRSNNSVYRELGATLLAKNGKMTIVMAIVGALIGFGGLAALFVSNPTGPLALNVGLPGVLLVLYGTSVAIVAGIGKQIRAYMGLTGDPAATASPAVSLTDSGA